MVPLKAAGCKGFSALWTGFSGLRIDPAAGDSHMKTTVRHDYLSPAKFHMNFMVFYLDAPMPPRYDEFQLEQP